jgi:excisionase family DNA binding protein
MTSPAKSLSPSQTRPVPRRGLLRTEAAVYLGISATKFDQLVDDGRMPRPRMIDSRKVWDIYQLDAAFDELPYSAPPIVPNSWADRI